MQADYNHLFALAGDLNILYTGSFILLCIMREYIFQEIN